MPSRADRRTVAHRAGRASAADTIASLIDDARRTIVPDPRIAIFDVGIEERAGGLVLVGETTHPEAVAHVTAAAGQAGIVGLIDDVVRLPDPALGLERHALVRAALAPVYATARLPAPQISQLPMGQRVDVLARHGRWMRVRGEDGYLGWVHAGYLAPGDEAWARTWECASRGEPVVSLGAELADDTGRTIARLPWGARVLRYSGAYEMPDGSSGTLAAGEVVDIDRLVDWFPPRAESVARTARRWLGAPYLWGGVTPAGVDCSGFAQAVLWMHGIAMPRDADLQARTGVRIETGENFDRLRAGDLVFFSEIGDCITHVAISLGGGAIIHAALTNGGVAINELSGEEPFDLALRRGLVSARRLLPD